MKRLKKEFTENLDFHPGEFYVIGKMNYPEKEYQIDHAFYLIEQINGGKSGFIDLKDNPEDY